PAISPPLRFLARAMGGLALRSWLSGVFAIGGLLLLDKSVCAETDALMRAVSFSRARASSSAYLREAFFAIMAPNAGQKAKRFVEGRNQQAVDGVPCPILDRRTPFCRTPQQPTHPRDLDTLTHNACADGRSSSFLSQPPVRFSDKTSHSST